MTRTELIAALLIEHSKYRVDGNLTCRCGHVYKLGESIAAHRAAVIDGALTLQECGISPEDVLDATRGVMKIITAAAAS